jgi:hypothetical protein
MPMMEAIRLEVMSLQTVPIGNISGVDDPPHDLLVPIHTFHLFLLLPQLFSLHQVSAKVVLQK